MSRFEIDWSAVFESVRMYLVDLDPRVAAVAVVLVPLLWRIAKRLRIEKGLFFSLSRGVAKNPIAAVLLGLPLVVLDLLTIPIAFVGSLRVKPAEFDVRGLRDALGKFAEDLAETRKEKTALSMRVGALERGLGIAKDPTERIEVASKVRVPAPKA